MTSLSDAAYVAAVLMRYADLPDTPLRPSPQIVTGSQIS